MAHSHEPTLVELILKTAVIHAITYFVMGLLAFNLLPTPRRT